MAQLGVLTIHGMGRTEENYADGLKKKLRATLGKASYTQLDVASVYYQDILQANEEAYFERVKARLDWKGLREFVLYGICDAASLESQKSGRDSPYFIAQSRILEQLRNLYEKLQGDTRQVIVVAQSLGGQVMSNYLWDASRKPAASVGVWSDPPQFNSPEKEAFCRGGGILRLLTTGCNIPIFVAGRAREDIKPIPRPNPDFQWHNYFDKDDVLGWPLRDLSDEYAHLVTDDHSINVGGVLSFTPKSHEHYWTDRSFLNPLAAHIRAGL